MKCVGSNFLCRHYQGDYSTFMILMMTKWGRCGNPYLDHIFAPTHAIWEWLLTKGGLQQNKLFVFAIEQLVTNWSAALHCCCQWWNWIEFKGADPLLSPVDRSAHHDLWPRRVQVCNYCQYSHQTTAPNTSITAPPKLGVSEYIRHGWKKMLIGLYVALDCCKAATYHCDLFFYY